MHKVKISPNLPFKVTYTFSSHRLPHECGARSCQVGATKGVEQLHIDLKLLLLPPTVDEATRITPWNVLQVDLATGQGISDLVALGPFDAIINCSAISQPGVCEQSPDMAWYETHPHTVEVTDVTDVTDQLKLLCV